MSGGKRLFIFAFESSKNQMRIIKKLLNFVSNQGNGSGKIVFSGVGKPRKILGSMNYTLIRKKIITPNDASNIGISSNLFSFIKPKEGKK